MHCQYSLIKFRPLANDVIDVVDFIEQTSIKNDSGCLMICRNYKARKPLRILSLSGTDERIKQSTVNYVPLHWCISILTPFLATTCGNKQSNLPSNIS